MCRTAGEWALKSWLKCTGRQISVWRFAVTCFIHVCLNLTHCFDLLIPSLHVQLKRQKEEKRNKAPQESNSLHGSIASIQVNKIQQCVSVMQQVPSLQLRSNISKGVKSDLLENH